MKNPAAVDQPKLNPLHKNSKGESKFQNPCKVKNNKGNLPYLKFRRILRKDMLRNT